MAFLSALFGKKGQRKQKEREAATHSTKSSEESDGSRAKSQPARPLVPERSKTEERRLPLPEVSGGPPNRSRFEKSHATQAVRSTDWSVSPPRACPRVTVVCIVQRLAASLLLTANNLNRPTVKDVAQDEVGQALP